MKLKTNIFSFDLARALAIIGVVAIHVFYPIYSRPDFLGVFLGGLPILLILLPELQFRFS